MKFNMVLTLTGTGFIALGFPAATWADRALEIEEALQEFRATPQEFMNRIPTKWDEDGNKLSTTESVFPDSAIKDGDFVTIKSSGRDLTRIHGSQNRIHMFEEIRPSDGLANFVDSEGLTKLSDIESRGLMSSGVKEQPWSGDYWPIYCGGIARRYMDPHFPNSINWKTNSDYILADTHASSLDQLSPAEKYDLLIGDANKSLTKNVLSEGQQYYDSTGKVETWMGICHGWAPASYRELRPTHSIDVLAQDGRTKIRFFPSDLKALVSLLWAKAQFQAHFAGTRCEEKSPKTNSVGRILDQSCFDENPGAWHIAVVDHLGVKQEDFIIDATFDYQVWNQPLLKYSYTYFNPETGKTVSQLDAAKVEMEAFTHDKFREFRSAKAKSVVGVAMDLTYVVETSANSSMQDSPNLDRLRTVRYLYDLELDSTDQIIGGEWYLNAHPDFLWMPDQSSQAQAPGDEELNNNPQWDGSGPMPAAWTKAAMDSSQAGQPLAHIVRALLIMSQLGN